MLSCTSSLGDFCVDVSFGLSFIHALELLVFSNDADRKIFVVELCLVRQSSCESLDTVVDELIQVTVLERVDVLLQVRASALGSCTDGHGSAVIVVSARASLIDVRSLILFEFELKTIFMDRNSTKLTSHPATSNPTP